MLELFRKLLYGDKPVRRLSGQRFEYHGHYSDGTATYVFRMEGESRVPCGRFAYKVQHDDYPAGKSTIRIRGRYADGHKRGRWLFTVGGNGYRRRLTLSYHDGVAEGVLAYSSTGHSYGMRSGYDHCRLRVELRQGHPAGMISVGFGHVSLNGQCDDDGYPDGTWTMRASAHGEAERAVEVWEHGRLADNYMEDLRHGHRKHSEPRMLSLLHDVVRQECTPLLNMVHSHTPEWDGSLPRKD